MFHHISFYLDTSANSDVGEVRLHGTRTPNEGRVEIRKNGGSWGLVCDHGFDINEANVFCHMLGYTNGAENWHDSSKFGHGNLDFHLDDMECTGEEISFLDCIAAPWDSHNCHSGQAAAVTCYPSKY